MDFDLPVLQYLFKIVQRSSICVYRIQEIMMELEEHTQELPMNEEFILEKVRELEEIVKCLSKYSPGDL